MSQATKRKVELILTQEEVGGFLQKIGRELEEGALVIGNTRIETEGFKSLGLSLKDEGDGDALRVKLKVKFPKQEGPVLEEEEATEEADEAVDSFMEEYEEDLLQPEPEEEFSSLSTRPRPKYKSLKKRMKAQWKGLKGAVERGQMPEKALVHAFARDSELMITYPDEGEEYYKPYETALQQFMVAIADNDVQAVAEAVGRLEEVKNACHSKHK